ncbi:hypothetical protein C8Q78DRAFT_988735 [Trametes maxima]|nr:hypothetical protein C8Q78DRAFT_988735 [Trametes maxima]
MGKSQNEELKEELKGDKCQTEDRARKSGKAEMRRSGIPEGSPEGTEAESGRTRRRRLGEAISNALSDLLGLRISDRVGGTPEWRRVEGKELKEKRRRWTEVRGWSPDGSPAELVELRSGLRSERNSDRSMSKYDRKGLEGTRRAETRTGWNGWSSLGVTGQAKVWAEFQNSGPGWHGL